MTPLLSGSVASFDIWLRNEADDFEKGKSTAIIHYSHDNEAFEISMF